MIGRFKLENHSGFFELISASAARSNRHAVLQAAQKNRVPKKDGNIAQLGERSPD